MIIYKQLNDYLVSLVNNHDTVLEIAGEPNGYLLKNTSFKVTSNISKLEGLDIIYDAHNSLFKNSSFDFIFMIAAGYFMEDQYKVFSEAYRNLKDDGTFVIDTYKQKILKKLASLQDMQKVRVNIEGSLTAHGLEVFL
ncbi:class I SAM-dependent methyltransferase [Desulfovibrio gilichinskyi]|uniref:Methyltransferase domain-containing protein n=1 Tax=Desulfovibrio gilichinskyi TaxID=1519643 RepID=A0A1X7EI56_9BACT|nr:methyltransferase domain-containing protein [Desulfovibrio gilichinskyi]SMF33952.1 Methyltransferase domain-containing protein [Desulfovibrio gilichinskyi]